MSDKTKLDELDPKKQKTEKDSGTRFPPGSAPPTEVKVNDETGMVDDPKLAEPTKENKLKLWENLKSIHASDDQSRIKEWLKDNTKHNPLSERTTEKIHKWLVDQDISGDDLCSKVEAGEKQFIEWAGSVKLVGGPATKLYNALASFVVKGVSMKHGTTEPSTQAVVDWMKGAARPEPFRLTFSPYFDFQISSRQKAGDTFMSAIGDLRSERSAATRRPLLATHGPPGGGKSRLLDFLAKLVTPMSENKWLGDAVAVSVTYNGGMQYMHELDNVFPEAGLAARLLFSWGPDELSWEAFAAAIMSRFRIEGLTVATAVEAVRVMSKKPNMLVLVDELSKCWDAGSTVTRREQEYQQTLKAKKIELSNAEARMYLLLHQLCALLDRMHMIPGSNPPLYRNGVFEMVVSTLDQVPVRAVTPDSNRNILWLPLPGLDAMKLSEFEEYKKDRDVQRMICDCGGHGRTLEKLSSILSSSKKRENESFGHDRPPNIVSVESDFMESIRPRTGAIRFEVVRMALLGDQVSMDHVAYENVQWREVISKGWLTNSLQNDPDFKPTMSGVMLKTFMTASVPPGKYQEEVGHVRDILTEMMKRSETDFFNFRAFEWYHAHWECLMTLLRRSKNLSEVYQGALVNPKVWPEFFHSPITSGPVVKVTELDHQWPGMPFNQYHQLDSSGSNLQPGRVILPAAGNHGFDAAAIKSRSGSPYVVCVQIRWSDVNSDTKVDSEAVKKCWDAVIQDFSARIEGTPPAKVGKRDELKEVMKAKELFNVKTNDICLVMIAFRDFASSVSLEGIPKDTRVALIDKRRLVALYGPTLVARPQFWQSSLLIKLK